MYNCPWPYLNSAIHENFNIYISYFSEQGIPMKSYLQNASRTRYAAQLLLIIKSSASHPGHCKIALSGCSWMTEGVKTSLLTYVYYYI